jgi:arylsulfatase A-like enzyme
MHNRVRRNTKHNIWLIVAVICLALTLPQCRRAAPARPNILLLVVDALRADHLGLYGYSRNTSPRLEEFARRGTVFDRAYAQAPSTFPSTAAMFTGRYPSHTQISSEEHWFELSRECTTLAEVLSDAGYQTGFFTANPLHAYDSLVEGERWITGFEQGFDEFFVGSQWWGNRLRAGELNEHAMKWIDQCSQQNPFLACLWYVDPHHPYEPPEQFHKLFPDPYKGETDWNKNMGELWFSGKSISEEERQHLISLYDAEIAYMDSCVGAMLDSLNATGVLADTMVILTADHGEAFHEHGTWVHGLGLHEEQIHVPLLIVPPGSRMQSKPRRTDSIAGHIDLMPTILDYANVDPELRPQEMHGLNLKPVLTDSDATLDRHGIGAEIVFGLKPDGEPATGTTRALITQRFKLIETRPLDAPVTTQLFDLESDPREERPVAEDPSSAEQIELMSAQLALIFGEPARRTGPLPEHIRKRLRALGYL